MRKIKDEYIAPNIDMCTIIPKGTGAVTIKKEGYSVNYETSKSRKLPKNWKPKKRTKKELLQDFFDKVEGLIEDFKMDLKD